MVKAFFAEKLEIAKPERNRIPMNTMIVFLLMGELLSRNFPANPGEGLLVYHRLLFFIILFK